MNKRVVKYFVFLVVLFFLAGIETSFALTCYKYSESFKGPCNGTTCGVWNDKGERACNGTQTINETEKKESFFAQSCPQGYVKDKKKNLSYEISCSITEYKNPLIFPFLNNQYTDTESATEIEVPGENGLKGKITFIRTGYGGDKIVNIEKKGEYIQEYFEYVDPINTSMIVKFQCVSFNCKRSSETSHTFTENGEKELTIESTSGEKLSQKVRVQKIIRIPPTGELVYEPDESKWTNGKYTKEDVLVMVEGKVAGEGGKIVGGINNALVKTEASSFICRKHGGCEGILTIKDMAENETKLPFKITNIDKIAPLIHLELFNNTGAIKNGKLTTGVCNPQDGCEVRQKVGIVCDDRGVSQSGCDDLKNFTGAYYYNTQPSSDFPGLVQAIFYVPLGSMQYSCFYDKVGNQGCMEYETMDTALGYTDGNREWSNRRNIWLKCLTDNLSGCAGDNSKLLYKNTNDTTLVVSDRAGNSVKKHYQIRKIDWIPPKAEIMPELGFESFEFKASEGDKIKIKFQDIPDNNDILIETAPKYSGIDKAYYSIGSSCVKSGISFNSSAYTPTFTERKNKLGTTKNGVVISNIFLTGALIGTGISLSGNGNDEDGFSVKINPTKAGDPAKNDKTTLYVCIKDKAGNITEYQKDITIHPGDLANDLDLVVDAKNTKYANDYDKYTYTITLKDNYGNPIRGKSLISVEQNIEGLGTGKTIFLDNTQAGGEKAFRYAFNPTLKSGSDGKMKFELYSYTPGEFTQRFKVEIPKWNDKYVDSGTQTGLSKILMPNNTFLDPVSIESIKISNDGGDVCSGSGTWEAKPEIGKEQRYKIALEEKGVSTGSYLSSLGGVSNGILHLTAQSVVDAQDGHKWAEDKIGGEVKDFGNNIAGTCLGFTGILDASSNALLSPIIKNKNLKVSYTFKGKNVAFYLSEREIEGCEKGTLGVKVQGNIQSDGKANATGQESNFSDFSTAEMRGIIKRNVTQLTKGMKDGNIVNGVKYVEGKDVIFPDSDFDNGKYETLVLKNGNVVITGEKLNPLKKKLGIVILKDNYDVNKDWKVAGNMYVANDVKEINAIIYADGTLRSANVRGEAYRDEYLLERLELNGSLFTRNTIGGATSVGAANQQASYLLPGGKKIASFDQAQIYDLNYIRKTPICGPDDYALFIKYDAKIQTNPPKGFTR